MIGITVRFPTGAEFFIVGAGGDAEIGLHLSFHGCAPMVLDQSLSGVAAGDVETCLKAICKTFAEARREARDRSYWKRGNSCVDLMCDLKAILAK